jgi:hypothetical protein
MRDEILKQAMVRLPVTISRAARRGARWHAELTSADGDTSWNPFTAEGDTEPQARTALTEVIAGTLHLVRQRPVLVVGGDEQYAQYLHLVNPEAGGWVVHAIRDGRVAATWHSDHPRDVLLRQVLDHVGGTPAVIHL